MTIQAVESAAHKRRFGRPYIVSPEEISKFMLMRKKHTVTEIAKMHDLNISVVYDALKRHPDYKDWKAKNVGRLANNKQTIGAETAATLHALVADGHYKSVICKKLNIKLRALNNALKRYPVVEQ